MLQTNFASSNKKYLEFSLVVTFLIWLIPFLAGKNIAVFTDDLFYIILSVLLFVVSVYRVICTTEKKSRITWILFMASSFAMLMAEHIWSVNELILDVKPFPSYADIGYISGALLWLPFLSTLILPLKKHVSKSNIALAICISCSIIIPSVIVLVQSSGNTFTLENTLLSSYPIIDGLDFFPVSIGLMLFFKGKTNFFPSLMFFAMLPQLVGDVVFQIMSINGTYYSGSIADLFFYFNFILFMFGAYDLNPLEKKENIGAKET